MRDDIWKTAGWLSALAFGLALLLTGLHFAASDQLGAGERTGAGVTMAVGLMLMVASFRSARRAGEPKSDAGA